MIYVRKLDIVLRSETVSMWFVSFVVVAFCIELIAQSPVYSVLILLCRAGQVICSIAFATMNASFEQDTYIYAAVIVTRTSL